MTEAELKAALAPEQVDRLVDRLAGLGFRPRGMGQEHDVYFNAPDRDFRRTDEALRLRTVNGRTYLTYKGAKEDVRSSTRRELEAGVFDHENTQRLLEALGYTAVFSVSKTRWTFVLDHVTACLDHVQGLGDFLELETLLEGGADYDAAVDRLLDVLRQLDIPQHALTRKSYLELLMAKATEERSS